jgi:hypothetical protein
MTYPATDLMERRILEQFRMFRVICSTNLGSKKRYAEWGIHWFRNPLKLPLLTLCGIALAIGHHLTFASFNGKIVSESLSMSQTTVKQIGNVFVFLVLAAFKPVIDDSYNQYIWIIVRRDSFKVQTLNKAFSLPTSPFSFSVSIYSGWT